MFLPADTSRRTMQRKYSAAITGDFCNEATTTSASNTGEYVTYITYYTVFGNKIK